jgi:PAS domain S-box-containing protein
MTDRIGVDTAAPAGQTAEASLEELLTFERLLADLSARFANVSGDQVETEIEGALKQLLEFLNFDRGNFGEFTADGGATILCSVAMDGAEQYPTGPAPAFLSWYNGQLRAEKIMHVRSIDDIPAEAIGEAEYYLRSGIRTSVGIPLRVGGRTVAFINFAAFRPTREWPDGLIGRLKIVGEVMAQALARKRSEAALVASETRWRSMFEASNLGITLIDQNLRYIAANAAFQAMLGYTDEELQQLTPLDVTVEEDRPVTEKRLNELQQGNKHHYGAVKQYRRKDGTIMWGHSYVSVVEDAHSRPRMFVGTVIDVTETKLVQDALRAAQAKLARVAQMTTMHTVAASIAHEVNQPLAAIEANGGAAMRFLAFATPDLDSARVCLKRMVADGRRASEVIDSIRAMFKKIDQEQAPLDINKLIQDVLVLMELRAHDVSVQTELNAELPKVMGSRVQLQQVILNLITNALDAMNTVTDRPRLLRLRSDVQDLESVRVSVEDSGGGIEPKDSERIFDAFFTTKPHGMGIGLSLCRSIIEAHNGRLWVSSSSDRGSVFNVVLPAIRLG